jgi:hypothetical protein
MIELATCSYRAMPPGFGVAVATSVGKPRGWHGSKAAGVTSRPYCNELAPYSVFPKWNHDEPTFRRLYAERLEAKADAIDARLAGLSAEHPGERLVLLCWCTVTHHDDYCHRLMARRWLEVRYEIEIPELTLDRQ